MKVKFIKQPYLVYSSGGFDLFLQLVNRGILSKPINYCLTYTEIHYISDHKKMLCII